jgi:hypothetical protein
MAFSAPAFLWRSGITFPCKRFWAESRKTKWEPRGTVSRQVNSKKGTYPGGTIIHNRNCKCYNLKTFQRLFNSFEGLTFWRLPKFDNPGYKISENSIEAFKPSNLGVYIM